MPPSMPNLPASPPHQGGINYSNAVTTVSPSFAEEITGGGAAGWLKTLFSKPEVRLGAL